VDTVRVGSVLTRPPGADTAIDTLPSQGGDRVDLMRTRDPWFVIDRAGHAIAGSFTSPASARRWITVNQFWDHPRGPLDVACRWTGTTLPPPAICIVGVTREVVPVLIDSFDVQVALWIGQSMVAGQ